MKNEPEWINRIVRHRKCLHRNITNGKLGASRKDPPVTVPFEWAVVANRFRRQSIAINRHIKLAAENFKSADVIGMFMREKDAIELLGRDTALLQAQDQLPRAQPCIDKNLAMIGCDERTVSRAPAAEDGQAEHGS